MELFVSESAIFAGFADSHGLISLAWGAAANAAIVAVGLTVAFFVREGGLRSRSALRDRANMIAAYREAMPHPSPHALAAPAALAGQPEHP